MKDVIRFVRFIRLGVLILSLGSAVFAQGGKNESSENLQASSSGLTGAEESREVTVAKAGRADGLGNTSLGGERRPLYRLHPSDVIEVTFTLAPEFNQTLTVQPDGYIALKDAGFLLAEGLTIPEFSERVRKAYAGYLHDPVPGVVLKDFERPFFVIGGEVGKPGKYELRSDTTVAEAVQIAGGLTAQAKHSQVVLFRRVNNDLVEARLLNLKKMLKQNRLTEDAHVQPGDLVYVPQNAISKMTRFITRPSMSMYMNSSQF